MAKKKILIADDERGTRESLKYLLDKSEWDVDLAGDGAKAKELIEINKYNIIFLDCNMPELTGIELIRDIKERWPESIIIVITGYDAINKEFAISTGAHEYIKKPFLPQEVERIIKKYKSF